MDKEVSKSQTDMTSTSSACPFDLLDKKQNDSGAARRVDLRIERQVSLPAKIGIKSDVRDREVR